jgi:hypothetical protein
MHPCRCRHRLVDRGLRGHVPARPECITPHIRFLFIALRFRLGLPPHPASRRRTCPLASLRLYKPGTGTFTQLDSCHARHTRGSHRRCAALSRSVRVDCRVGQCHEHIRAVSPAPTRDMCLKNPETSFHKRYMHRSSRARRLRSAHLNP